MSNIEDLKLAQQELNERGFSPASPWPNPNITKTYVGVKEVAGKDSGDEAVIVCVPAKLTRREMSAQGVTAIPTVLAGLPTDVQEEPRAEMLRLGFSSPEYRNFSTYPYSPTNRPFVEIKAGEDHRKCYDPAQGGIEMQPYAKPWVGTFGGLCWFRWEERIVYGGFTNWHVSGDGMARGYTQVQPGGGSAFGQLVAAAPVTFDGSPNYLDLALLDLQRGDKWSAIQRQLKGGPVADGIHDALLRDVLRRDGRTFGYIPNAQVRGVSAQYQVGMGSGRVSLFVDGDVLRKPDNTAASAGGDSGSMFVHVPSNQPSCHLHAGGGRDTMALPFRNVTRWLEGGIHFTVPK